MGTKNSIRQHYEKLKSNISNHRYLIIIIVLIICTICWDLYSVKHPNDPFSTMIALFVLLCLGVAVVTSFILSIPIRHKTARKIEVFGYILLLILLVWQLTIRDSLDSMSNHDYLEIKVDTIFEYLTSHDADKDRVFQKYYYTIAGGESRDYVEQELLISNYFVVGLQILSTLCIAIGRFDDISVKKAEK